MKLLKIIGSILGVLVVLYLIFAAVSPSSIQIERSTIIEKSPEVVYAQVNDFRKWTDWSPWEKADSNMVIEYSEGTGLNAWMSWKSETQGNGRQEIVATEATSSIKTKLNFEGWDGDSYADWAFEAADGGTKVTWSMDGAEMPFMIRPMIALSIGMVEKNYEDGLAALKSTCEALADAPKTYRGFEIVETNMEPRTYIGVSDTVNWADIQQFYTDNLGPSFAAAREAGLEIVGRPSGLYWYWDVENQRAYMAATAPVAGEASVEGFESWLISGKTYHIAYYGSYDGSIEAHEGMAEFMKEKSIEQPFTVIEEYVTDPVSEPDTSKWLTNIYYVLGE